MAEAIDTEEDIAKRQKHLDALNTINSQLKSSHFEAAGFNCMPEQQQLEAIELTERIAFHEAKCSKSIEEFKRTICASDMLVKADRAVSIEKGQKRVNFESSGVDCAELVSWAKVPSRVSVDELLALNAKYLAEVGSEKHTIEGTGDIFDSFSDCLNIRPGTKELTVFAASAKTVSSPIAVKEFDEAPSDDFSFDYQPNLLSSPGPSPSIILHALTMSNANDGINLERLETIGDSFLKYAITTYLYLMYENVHEGKLSHLRSKQVSNLNLYRLGRRKILGESMIATKFEPHDNWLPPCYYVPKELEQALIAAKIPACHWNLADLPNIKQLSSEEICRLVKERAENMGLLEDDDADSEEGGYEEVDAIDEFPCFIPYNLVTQHSIPDKSIADCVEALIGAYLIECGPKGALLFMAWLGIRVLPLRVGSLSFAKPLTN